MLPRRRLFNSFVNGDWSLSPEQVTIRDSALKFAREEMAPFANEWDEKCHFPRDVIKKTASLGFAGLYCSPDYGGVGLSRHDSSLVFEALATGCIGTTAYLTVHNMVAWLLDSFGSSEQKERWLSEMFTLNKLGSYCLTEPGSGSDSKAMRSTAIKQGDYYILDGQKMFITGGDASDLYLVMCKTGQDEYSCIAIEKGTPGLSFGKNEKKLGWNSHPTTLISFDNCKVPAVNVISQPGQGFKMAMMALDGGRVNIASCALGGA